MGVADGKGCIAGPGCGENGRECVSACTEYTVPTESLRSKRVKRVSALFFSTPPFFQNTIMATRTPLQQISGNRRVHRELTPNLRGIIEGHYRSGLTYGQIAEELKIPRTTVQFTIQQLPQRLHGFSKPRSGRLRKTTVRTMRRVIRYIQQHPFTPYA